MGDESPWGSFSEYTKLNPYLRPYGENGEILKRLDNFVIFTYTGGRTTDYANPMYNATLIQRTGQQIFPLEICLAWNTILTVIYV